MQVMHGTRRYWSGVGLVVVLLFSALLTARPVMFVAAAMIGASLVAYQYAFVHGLSHTVNELVVEEVIDSESVATDETTTVMLRVDDRAGASLALTIESQPPVGARITGERTVNLSVDDPGNYTSFEATWPVTGTFQFDQPHLAVRDRYGLFYDRVPIDTRNSPTITVEPRGPQEMHIGRGGNRIEATYGEHESEEFGSGLEPDVLREYTAEDSADRIDWKTTARMNEPYVREYEENTDRKTVVLMDTRACMTEGPSGETKLDYARQVGMALADSAHSFNDPLGLYVITDAGLTTRMRPTAQRSQYVSIRERIRDLVPDADADPETATLARTPSAIHRASTQLTDRSAFATRLRPYFDTSRTQLQRIDRDPLFRTVRSHVKPLQGSIWTAIITDDTHRAELREAVLLARRGNGRVLVFLAPSVLFESRGLSDVDEAYERYLEFEEFRRQLAQLDRVSAFEIGPDDRIDTVLTSGAQMHHASQQTPTTAASSTNPEPDSTPEPTPSPNANPNPNP